MKDPFFLGLINYLYDQVLLEILDQEEIDPLLMLLDDGAALYIPGLI
jgi:hypothetical protein